MSSTVAMTVQSLFFFGAILIFVVHTEALPARPLSEDLDPEASSTDMVLLTLCWDGQTLNPRCQTRRTLLRQLLLNLLFQSKPAARDYGATDEELEEDVPEVKPLRMSSKGKRRDNKSGFYSDW
ncbi:hypothetical protein PoB_000776600 [Plakobranchus ocellatus]|uniref:Uncharacterized protein n=1 Tax=Plakobranchus ocellatus TaxID=259542 RepID=A0AAV3Y209_9GAST|nr:hypothetical protein PoB_000776600 [Plakobranchus ocellatus]